jgi:hypothetical protein
MDSGRKAKKQQLKQDKNAVSSLTPFSQLTMPVTTLTLYT